MYSPDWFYGFVPPGWTPDRPRECFFPTVSVLPLGASVTLTTEVIASKKTDLLVFGGSALVTDVTNTSVSCPLSGPWSQTLCALRNGGSAESYSAGFNQSTPVPGLVPLENMFAIWQTAAQRPVYWPLPIAVRKGGTLMMDLQNTRAVAVNIRFTFYCALIYDFTDVERGVAA